jgi:hypothetical protein
MPLNDLFSDDSNKGRLAGKMSSLFGCEEINNARY